MTRDEQRQREKLHAQAEQLTARLHSRHMQTEAGSPESARHAAAVRRASQRAERRYQASLAP